MVLKIVHKTIRLESKTVMDSGFQIPLSYWILAFVSGTWILDSNR